MDGEQIHTILMNDPMTSVRFRGVFARDTIPNLEKNQGIIINTDESSLPGTHWLAIYKNEDDELEFFDSFGRSPYFYGFDLYNLFDVKKVCWNSVKFQSITSNVCGAYCIFFLYKRCRNVSMLSILRRLNVNKRNDFVMYQFVKKKFGVRFALIQ